MMNKIRNAVIFVAGAIYGWALTYTFTHSVEAASSPMIIPAVIISFFGGFGIIFGVVYFLITNWDKP